VYVNVRLLGPVAWAVWVLAVLLYVRLPGAVNVTVGRLAALMLNAKIEEEAPL
jgi:hypothetical protein